MYNKDNIQSVKYFKKKKGSYNCKNITTKSKKYNKKKIVYKKCRNKRRYYNFLSQVDITDMIVQNDDYYEDYINI